MLTSVEDVVAIARGIYGSAAMPREFKLAAASVDLRAGVAVDRKLAGTTARRLEEIAGAADPVATIFGATLDEAAQDKALTRARRGLGQMLVGLLAERAFEALYVATLGSTELRLEDFRSSRNDTDYRVRNGGGKPVFRINIKFHGTPFKRAQELVGLDPSDCFALATYKIKQALDKQDNERLAYLFVVVGVRDMTGERVGAALPDGLVHLMSLVLAGKMSGKRVVEDQIVKHLLDGEQPPVVRAAIDGFARQIEGAEWRVLSARRADKLLRDNLYERVYALRVPGFAKNYGRAELDMHFSLSRDLTPLSTFLGYLRDHGLHGVSVRLERGEL